MQDQDSPPILKAWQRRLARRTLVLAVLVGASLVAAGCGSSGATSISNADEETVYHAVTAISEKATHCDLESLGKPTTANPTAGMYSDVSALIEVFRKNPNAVDSEQHESMRTELDKAIESVKSCAAGSSSVGAEEAQRLRDALTAAG